MYEGQDPISPLTKVRKASSSDRTWNTTQNQPTSDVSILFIPNTWGSLCLFYFSRTPDRFWGRDLQIPLQTAP